MISYGKYHHSVFITLFHLAESQCKISMNKEAFQNYKQAKEIATKIRIQNVDFEMQFKLKCATLDASLNMEDKLKLIQEAESILKDIPVMNANERLSKLLLLNNQRKDIYYNL